MNLACAPTPQLARQQVIQARGNRLPPDGAPGPAVLDSWVRCLHAGLDPHAPLTVPVVQEADLRLRRERDELVRRLARAELETLSRQIAGSNFLLAFADREGVILDLYADNQFSMSGEGASIRAGSCWAEARCGTNGLGTALATGAPVAVTGLEHYYLSLGDISCTAAPVRDARGSIVGVLDASSYVDSRQRHTQALVHMAATHIENGLLLAQMRQHWVLALHPRPEFLGTLSVGLVAFDAQGNLVATNACAARLLQGLALTPGRAFEALFSEPMDRVLAQMQRHGEQRLRDVMGSAVVARCVGMPAHAWPSAYGPARGVNQGQGRGWGSETGRASASAVSRLKQPARVATQGMPGDAAVAQVYQLATLAARRQLPMLLTGETGTGKEVLARHVHQTSGRSGAFVAVNCGALPHDLVEAELFGYVGGSYSGSRREGSLGLIASAEGGTLLLDELGELPLPLQTTLLRFLDDHQVRPVGGTTARKVDVHVLAATHARLEAEVAAKRFRADLLYRLNTVCLHLPPLRARRDFQALVRDTLAELDVTADISPAAIALLAAHSWPGNFRELRSVLTRALLALQPCHDVEETLEGGCIQEQTVRACLPYESPDAVQAAVPGWHNPECGLAASASRLQQGVDAMVRTEFQRTGNVSATARALGISRTTVYRHLRT